MNERIQELALEAGKYADETQPRGSYTRDGMWLYAYNEKFAELIVRECIGIVANADMTGSWITHPKDVLCVACDQVKKHFGVEE
jgi:hypothetical protein